MPSTSPITIDACTFDVGIEVASIEAYVEACAARVEQSWDSGADIVLLPEYTWAGLEPHLPEGAGLRGVAERFWHYLMPGLYQRLARPEKMVVLGTAPFVDPETQLMYNRAPIIAGGRLLTQDKLYLTPWERTFTRGEELRLFNFLGLRIAVVICLDIEIPELSVLLRGQGIDLILVPSATETLQGCERVTRCASARSVELGCAVIVAPLVGRCASELVDDNLGKLACYLPSQRAFRRSSRMVDSAVHSKGIKFERFSLEQSLLTDCRASTVETNPANLDLGLAKPRLTMV